MKITDKNYNGVLLFTPVERNAFMDVRPAIGYNPEQYKFKGKQIIVLPCEIEKDFGDGRYLVQKKFG
jgi:hypothetical protein